MIYRRIPTLHPPPPPPPPVAAPKVATSRAADKEKIIGPRGVLAD